MAGRDDLDIWTQMVNARYLNEGRTGLEHSKCLACNSTRCKNYYCLRCKIGGLCPSSFKQNHRHEAHPWIQVKRQTKHNAVAAKDLERFIHIDNVNHIHKSSQNKEDKCYLKCRIPDPSRFIEKRAAAITEKLKKCETCKYAIPKSKSNWEDFLVCSVQCLIGVAENRPQLNLLRLRNGAIDRMEGPQTANEKLIRGTSAPTALVAVPRVQGVAPRTANEKLLGGTTSTARVAAPMVAMPMDKAASKELKRKRISPSIPEDVVPVVKGAKLMALRARRVTSDVERSPSGRKSISRIQPTRASGGRVVTASLMDLLRQVDSPSKAELDEVAESLKLLKAEPTVVVDGPGSGTDAPLESSSIEADTQLAHNLVAMKAGPAFC